MVYPLKIVTGVLPLLLALAYLFLEPLAWDKRRNPVTNQLVDISDRTTVPLGAAYKDKLVFHSINNQ